MRDQYDREAANRLARAVLAGRELNEVAGLGARAELADFDLIARSFHNAPQRRRRWRTRRPEPLGFGVDGITSAVTALVLAIVVDTLSQLAAERVNRSANRFASWFRRVLLRRPGPSPEPGPESGPEPGRREDTISLTPAHMQRIHRIALRHARRMSVPAQTAEAIANGIVAELAIAPAARNTPVSAADPGEEEAGGAAS
ncbi:hypothetical protein H1V43_24380 [Streptomyces sp. PSKA54]|uniref:Uncharacterized protein n=1 Tax=Streptomyces himalayensis subsp. aureolus TaxID=2758039 RepID=A0A7W2D450_9ACTN|nr:hypothetical protein [Streptomyces himalayensis]MBA4864432.1 hypothetical protein [Streptomyces himalayensis subsp. aureolus]